jgi:hypothetical protein
VEGLGFEGLNLGVDDGHLVSFEWLIKAIE